jgi:nitrogen fixation protein NifU and related proteins
MNELYQELIVDHGKRPRNFRSLECPTCSQEGFNPLCGDRINISLIHDRVTLQEVAFQGQGCAICMASCSLMLQALKGRTIDEALLLFDRFYSALLDEDLGAVEELGKLKALMGVRAYPSRVKCATLAWHTLKAALENKDQSVTTE